MDPVVEGAEDRHREAEVIGLGRERGNALQRHLSITEAAFALGADELGGDIALGADAAGIDQAAVIRQVEAVDVEKTDMAIFPHHEVIGVPVAHTDADVVQELHDAAQLLKGDQRATRGGGVGARILAGHGKRIALEASHHEARELRGGRISIEHLGRPGESRHGVGGLVAKRKVAPGHRLDLDLMDEHVGVIGVIDLRDRARVVDDVVDDALGTA